MKSLETGMKPNGFSLLEVLLALLVCTIALTAIVQTINAQIRHYQLLWDNTVAHWVAMNAIQANPTNQMYASTVMLNSSWHWQATTSTTPINGLKKLTIEVRKQPQGAVLTSLSRLIRE